MKGINNYISSVNEERSLIKEQRDENEAKRAKTIAFMSQDVEDIITSYNNESNELVSFEALRLIKMNERERFNELVEVEKTYEDANKMIFLTYMQEGGSLGLHHHDCLEIVNIVKGELIEKERSYKVYKEGDQVCYGVYEKHRAYATRNSIYEVIFLKI